jgi:hypothetical protein
MNLETLFSNHSRKYDTKKITNRAPKLVKDADFFNLLKTDGLTSEYIKSFKHPIFKYTSQITLHGIFDNSDIVKVGGYANVVVNKNGSIGIKYNAIDYRKKRELAKYLELFGWNYCRDSRGDQFSQMFKDKESCLQVWNAINLDRFYCSKFVMRNPLTGWYYICINVNALLANEIWDLFTAITGATPQDAEIKARDKAKADEAREAKYQAERLIRQQQDAERALVVKQVIETDFKPLMAHLKDFNGTFVKDMIIVRAAYDAYTFKAMFVYYKLTKAGAYYTAKKLTGPTVTTDLDFSSYRVNKTSERDLATLLRRIKFTDNNYKVL